MLSGLLILPVLFTGLIPVFFQVDFLMADSCLVTKSCLFCNPIVYSTPSSSVHGISQAGRLEWVAVSFSRGSSCPRDRTRISQVSCIAVDSLPTEPSGKPLASLVTLQMLTRHRWLLLLLSHFSRV